MYEIDWEKVHKGKVFTSCAHFVDINKRDDGTFEYFYNSYNTACHAMLGNWKYYKEDRENLKDKESVFINLFSKYGSNNPIWVQHPEMAKAYLDNLANRSAWKTAFFCKNPEEMLEHKGIIMDQEANCHLFKAACIQTRALWEYDHRVFIWYHMVQAGVNENLAHLLCEAIECNSTGKVYTKFNVKHPNNWTEGHRSVDLHRMDKIGTKAFIEGEFINHLKADSFRKEMRGSVVSALFYRDGNSILPPLFSEAEVEVMLNGKGKKAVNSNPFAVQIPQDSVFSKELTIEQVCEFSLKIQEKIMEVVNE